MVIDAHTHLGRGGALLGRAIELLASMDKAGIDKSLVFAGRINSITTEQVIDEIAPFKGRLYAVGSVTKSGTNEAQTHSLLRGLFENGSIVGLKFYPGYEDFYPADTWLRSYLHLAMEFGKPVIFHAGDTVSTAQGARLKYALPIHIDDLAVDMPELKIIIAHCGYPWQREAGEVVYKNKNVYADISGFVYGAFDQSNKEHFYKTVAEFISIAGTDERLLFGTDWPIGDQKSYVDTVKELWPLSPGLFHSNAEKLFGL